MQVRSGKTRSLVFSMLTLVITGAGVMWRMRQAGGESISLDRLAVFWLLAGLILAGLAFYNALRPRELSIYEVEFDDDITSFCPHCSTLVGKQDRYCHGCGHLL